MATKIAPRDTATVDSLYTPAPTITLTSGSGSTVTGSTAVLPPDTRYKYIGAGGFAYGAAFPDTVLYYPNSRYSNVWGSPPHFAVTFSYTGQLFDFVFKYANAAAAFRLKVNGKWVNDIPQPLTAFGTPTAVGNRHTLKVDFGTSATRTITLESSYMPFGGIFIAPGATLNTAPVLNGLFIAIGDSITGGSANNSGLGLGTYPWRLGAYLGIDNTWNAGTGSTGYVATGTSVAIPTRFQRDVVSYAPDGVIYFAGYNDITGYVAATFNTAVMNTFNAAKAAGIAENYVFGCYSNVATPTGSMTTVDEALRVNAKSAGFPFASPLTGLVYNAAGTQIGSIGPLVTAANVATFIGTTDAVHPSDEGHETIAGWMRSALLLMSAATTAATVNAGANQTADSFDTVTVTASQSGTGTITWTQMSPTTPVFTGLAGTGASRTGTAPAAQTPISYTMRASEPGGGFDEMVITVAQHNEWKRNAAGTGWVARWRRKRNAAGTAWLP